MSKRIGIIASAGGSAIFALLPFIKAHGAELIVATDRSCGIEEKCAAQGVVCQRFDYSDKDVFSQQVAEFFKEQRVSLVLLYYIRMIGEVVFNAFSTVNFHPSLLPAFAGLGALKQTEKAGVKLIGSTAHIANDRLDSGPILAQIADSHDDAICTVEKLSYVQKIYLTLVVLDSFFSGENLDALRQRRASDYINASPSPLMAASIDFFRKIEAAESLCILGKRDEHRH